VCPNQPTNQPTNQPKNLTKGGVLRRRTTPSLANTGSSPITEVGWMTALEHHVPLEYLLFAYCSWFIFVLPLLHCTFFSRTGRQEERDFRFTFFPLSRYVFVKLAVSFTPII
jgi:hypothetical protein